MSVWKWLLSEREQNKDDGITVKYFANIRPGQFSIRSGSGNTTVTTGIDTVPCLRTTITVLDTTTNEKRVVKCNVLKEAEDDGVTIGANFLYDHFKWTLIDIKSNYLYMCERFEPVKDLQSKDDEDNKKIWTWKVKDYRYHETKLISYFANIRMKQVTLDQAQDRVYAKIKLIQARIEQKF
jgi:hypothetical protein